MNTAPLLGVFPVLPAAVGLLTIIVASLLSALAAAATLRPAAVKTLARALWRQRRGLVVLGLLVVLVAKAAELICARRGAAALSEEVKSASWPVFRGTLDRAGHADRRAGPLRGGIQWSGGRGHQFFASPAIVGDTVIAVGSRGDSARFFCWDASSGEIVWSVAPRGYQATFSSPVVEGGYLLCGEGLHTTPDARLMCLNLGGESAPTLTCQFPTASHVECTPVVADGRVYFGAGDDGVYCLELISGESPSLRVVWHALGERYPDAETSLAVYDGRVYVGLGNGGESLCVLDADTGREIKRLAMPYPVFSPPAIQGDRLYLGMGRASYASDNESSPGEIRCLDLVSLETLWTLPTSSAVLAAVVAQQDDVIFSTVDGQLFVVGRVGHAKRTWHARAPMLTAPAVTDRMIYCVSCDGLLTGLDRRRLEPVWSVRLGAPGSYDSSPVVYRGHVYVGTPEDGFLCVGEPPPESSEEISPGGLGGPGRAGALDDSPIPSVVDVAWTLSGPSDEHSADVSAPPAVAGRDLVVPMAAADWAGLVCVDIAQPGGPRTRWTWECPERIVVSPAISGNVVVCVRGEKGRAGQLVGIERTTGKTLWSQPVKRVTDSLCVDSDSVYLSDDAHRLARFGLDGERLWHVDLGQLDHAIHVRGEIVVAAATDPNRLLALDRISGRKLWQTDLLHAASDSPVILRNRVLVPTSAGIDVRSLVDGSLLSTIEGCSSSAPMHIDADRVVATTRDGELAIYGPSAPRVVRQRWSGAKPNVPPLVGADSVVFAADDRRLMRVTLNGTNSPAIWYKTPDERHVMIPPVLHDSRVYVGVVGMGLVCLEARSE